ncbi:hypothetical protein G4Z05_16045 [Bacillus thermocopriae]|uniref:Uncharacterized protein n=1 Tax=Neobacillus thermocopriae TaxID=1215031 RepID=A0A6B3TWM0_9BACI|nr:hypothetical protein [Neobacillus thermocopriae]NEX80341.1 hypothetical protein [Neobacillus thermocopriae]
MQTNHSFDEKKVMKTVENHYHFIQSFIKLIIKYFFVYSYAISSKKKKNLTEKQIIQSLLLIEKLHMYMNYRHYLYNQVIPLSDDHFTYYSIESNNTYLLIKKLQHLIKQHHFVHSDNQLLCNNIISQILNYYPASTVKIIILKEPSPPWKPPNH